MFLGIGVLALLGGAILGGVFDGPTAEASPTPSEVVSTPTPEPTPEPTPTASATASLGAERDADRHAAAGSRRIPGPR